MLVLFIKKQLFTSTSLGAHWLASSMNIEELDVLLDYIVNALCAACLLTMIMQKESHAQNTVRNVWCLAKIITQKIIAEAVWPG